MNFYIGNKIPGSHISVNVDASLKDDRKRDEIRQELVNVPDLQPIIPFPAHFNQVLELVHFGHRYTRKL